mmetsp:Transcript_24867/g.81848  ORF Transcript_24867/g.81848 Transcript_24867/m.81848 type:complete len:225 (-) Transcript_24867:444-1118(-)
MLSLILFLSATTESQLGIFLAKSSSRAGYIMSFRPLIVTSKIASIPRSSATLWLVGKVTGTDAWSPACIPSMLSTKPSKNFPFSITTSTFSPIARSGRRSPWDPLSIAIDPPQTFFTLEPSAFFLYPIKSTTQTAPSLLISSTESPRDAGYTFAFVSAPERTCRTSEQGHQKQEVRGRSSAGEEEGQQPPLPTENASLLRISDRAFETSSSSKGSSSASIVRPL